jgi:hypothetical protein
MSQVCSAYLTLQSLWRARGTMNKSEGISWPWDCGFSYVSHLMVIQLASILSMHLSEAQTAAADTEVHSGNRFKPLKLGLIHYCHPLICFLFPSPGKTHCMVFSVSLDGI